MLTKRCVVEVTGHANVINLAVILVESKKRQRYAQATPLTCGENKLV